MSELNSLGLGPNQKRNFMAFENAAIGCPRCGFATSDVSLYECPSCTMVWKQRPKPLETSKGPEAGSPVRFICVHCGKNDADEPLVFAGSGTDLIHLTCMALQGEPSKPLSPYERLIREATPIEELDTPTLRMMDPPKLSKSQRRRRNQKARAHALATAERVEPSSGVL